MNNDQSPVAGFVSADTPEAAKIEAHDLELLRAGEAGEVELDALPTHIRERIVLRRAGVSVSPFTGHSES